MNRSAAPMPAPPDIEPIDDGGDRHAPVTFRPLSLGRFLVCLGAWEIGELQPADNSRHAFQFIIRLPGLRAAWHRPVAFSLAQDRVVEIVRQWIEATPIAAWVIERERDRYGARPLTGVR